MNIRKQVLKVFMFVFFASVMIVPAKAVQFSDLAPNHWGYEKVMEFAERGVLSGYEDNTFRPDNTITRAEFVHVVNNYFGYSGNEDKIANFSDLDPNEWYIRGINEAVARGYVVGYEDGTFRPAGSLTRQEAIVVLAKILNIADEEIPATNKDYLKKYTDYADIADWAEKSVYNYAIREFISGYEDGTLRPTNYITRTELVYLLNSIEQQIVVEKPSKGGGGSGGGSSSRVTYYTITVEETQNGTVVADTTRVEKGKDAKITVTPATDYELTELLDNGQSVLASVVNGVYTITNVQDNHTISATFSLIPDEPVYYTITVNCNKKGTAVADLTEVEAGKTVVITLTPGKAYRLYTIEDNSEDVFDKVENGVYIITNVQENHIVDVTFGCNCDVYINKLIEVLKEIADVHVDLLVEKLEACKGDAEAIRAEIEAVLGEKIENSEYKEEIEAVITELQAVDYKGLSVKAIAVLGKIVTSQTVQNAFEKIESLVSEEDKAEVKELLNKIEEKINAEVDNVQIKIEDFIKNHDCVEVQEFITKLINKLESIDNMEELIAEIEKYIKANVSEEDVKIAIEALKEKYDNSLEKLKAELEENKEEIIQEIADKIAELKEKQEAIEEAIEEIKAEIKENLPTDEELKEMAEELLSKGEATLETLKETLEEEIQKREEEIQEGLENAKAQWEAFLEEVKNTIVENLPSNEDLDELLDLIETKIPEIEELTGLDIDGIANELGIDKETVKEVIEAINGNEELKAELEETIKDKLTDVISNALSNNETVKQVLDKIYAEADMDVVDLILLLDKEDTTGIATKVVLSNTELTEVLNAIDEDIAEEDLETVVTACVDYYGLNNFIQTVDGEDNAKELLTIAIENANILDLIEVVQDEATREIILDNFTISELATILGPRGEDVINSLLGIAKVSYNKNAGKATGETAGSTHNKYLAMPLTAYGFTREGYTFKGWSTTENGSVEFTDKQSIKSTELASSNVTLYAVWEAISYDITGGYEADGNKVVAKVSTAIIDEEVELEVTVAEWYEVIEIKANDELVTKNNGVYSFTMPAEDVEITASFRYTYVAPTAHTVTTISSDTIKGTISADKTAEIKDETVTITVSPKTGYKLSSITANNGTVSLTKVSETKYTFIMPDTEVTVSAAFEAIEYIITVNKTGEGKVNVVETATVGQEITITTTPATGYELTAITSDEVTITNGKFTMPAGNVEIDVTFELKDYKVTINKLTDNGDVTVNLAQEITDANMGDTILVTVITDTGYDAEIIFDKEVTIKNSSSDANGVVTSFEMPASDVVVTVEFTKVPTYSVSGNISNGKIYFTTSLADMAENSLSGIKEDEEVTITIVPDSGYEVTGVTATDDDGEVDVTKSTVTYKFTMGTSDVTVDVEVVQSAFDIIVVKDDGGTVEIEQKALGIYYPVTQAKKDEKVYITASKDGYTLKDITISGASDVEKDLLNGKASFTMLDSDVEISVEFEEILEAYSITIAEVTNGTITVDISDDVVEGKTVTITAQGASYGFLKYYKISEAIITDLDGNTLKTVDLTLSLSGYTGTFEMPDCDIIITGTFTK